MSTRSSEWLCLTFATMAAPFSCMVRTLLLPRCTLLLNSRNVASARFCQTFHTVVRNGGQQYSPIASHSTRPTNPAIEEIESAIRSENAGAALAALRRHGDKTPRHVYGQVLALLVKKQLASEAYDLLWVMRRKQLKVFSGIHSKLIDMLLRAKKLSQANDVYNFLRESHLPNNSMTVMLVVENARGGNVARAMELLDLSRKLNQRLPATLYWDLVDALLTHKQTASAEKVLSYMDNDKSFFGDHAMRKKRVEAEARMDKLSMALQHYREYKSNGTVFDDRTFSQLIAAAGRTGDAASLKEIESDAGMTASNASSVVLVDSIIQAHVRLGNWETARTWFKSLRERGALPSMETLSVLLPAIQRVGGVRAVADSLIDVTSVRLVPVVELAKMMTPVLSKVTESDVSVFTDRVRQWCETDPSKTAAQRGVMHALLSVLIEERRNISSCETVLAAMKQSQHLQPDAHTYRTIVASLSRIPSTTAGAEQLLKVATQHSSEQKRS